MATDPHNTPHPPADPPKLLAGYFNGTLDAELLAELEQWVRADPANADTFARYAIEQRALENALKHDRVGDLADLTVSEFDVLNTVDPTELELVTSNPPDGSSAIGFVIDQALAERRKHDIEDEANRQLAAQQAEDARNRRYELRRQAEAEPVKRVVVIPKALVWLGLAAVIGLVVTPAIFFGRSTPTRTQLPANPTPQVQRDPMPSPANVAFVRSSVDARWSTGSMGDSMYLQEQTTVTLSEGLAEVVFDDGAAVIVQAPATFEPTGTNGMRVISGRVTATVPPTAHGFTIATPGGLVTDYGTEFGVIVNHDGQTLAQTFTGRIGLTPHGGAEVDLEPGDAAVAAPTGRVRTVEADELAFVRAEEFEAIRNTEDTDRNRWVAARYRMLRDPGVLAFVPFIRPGSDWPDEIGVRGLRVGDGFNTGPTRPIEAHAYAQPIDWRGDTGFGGALVGNGTDAYYIDLDTAPGGTFHAAGLLDDYGLVGRPGTTLYLACRMQSDGTGDAPEGFAGLSLMRGDRREFDEPLFFGCASDTADWSAHARHLGADVVEGDDIRPIMVNGRALRVDDAPHLWLVRIDFAGGPDGQDRVRFYFDPDLSRDTLPEPNLTLSHPDVSFDRLRFTSGDGARAWRVDELLVSTTRPTVPSGTLPGAIAPNTSP